MSEPEHEILFYLQEVSAKKPLLLLMDDLQYWDAESLGLVQSFLNSSLEKSHAFTREMRIIACRTINREDGGDANFSQIKQFTRWRLDYIDAGKIAEALEALGLRTTLPPTTLTSIYSICGGHLEVLRRLAEYLQTDQDAWPQAEEAFLTGTEQILESLLDYRLQHMGKQGSMICELLGLASIVGSSFSRHEISCLIKSFNNDLAEFLLQARELDFIREDEEHVSFSHEILQRYFQKKNAHAEPAVHDAFASCIARLRPADYASRAQHLALAGKTRESNYLRFIAYLQSLREGKETPAGELHEICQQIEDDEVPLFYRSMDRAYNNLIEGKASEALEILRPLEDTVPPLLLAEKDYLIALCLRKSKSAEDRKLAKRLLESWSQLKESEAEQWFRILSALTVIQAGEGDFTEARLNERSLVSYFTERAAYDPFALSGLNVLRRRCAALHSAEIAAERCRRAAEYFGPPDSINGSSPRNPLQLYMALTNLSGNLLMLGLFEQAKASAGMAIDLSSRISSLRFPRIEIPINNLVISAFLTGAESSIETSRLLSETLQSAKSLGDRLLLINNLAVARALSGDIERAEEELASVLAISSYDDFYHYFIRSNLIALAFLRTGDMRARSLWIKLIDNIPRIAESDRAYLVRRHQLQEEAFSITSRGDVRSWNLYLQERHPNELGQTWRFYGKGLLFSDIQFWSES